MIWSPAHGDPGRNPDYYPTLPTLSLSLSLSPTRSIQIFIHITINIHKHTYTHTDIHTYIHTYVHTYIRTYRHTYIRTYVHTYIRTYVHTYIQTNTQHMGAAQKSRYVTGSRASFRDIGFVTKPFCLRQAVSATNLRDKPPRQAFATGPFLELQPSTTKALRQRAKQQRQTPHTYETSGHDIRM